MTTDELHTQVLELFDLHVRKSVDTRSNQMVKSGAIDIAIESPRDYAIAKTVLAAALKAEAEAWWPLMREGRALAKNLAHF
ncbi:MAG: hypothetical protein IH919_07930 [Deltaproteobacteria bacterium]|nr:hypothetical protein [Deltaproteobacteria bacterium]